MIRGCINLIMNTTQQLKRIFKHRQNDVEALNKINKQLTLILKEIKDLKSSGQNSTPIMLNKTGVTGEEKKETCEDLYVPEVNVDNMEVKAHIKTLSNEGCGDIESKIEKLNKLGGN